MKHLEIERLAYYLWRERGMPFGSPERDWFLAEELVRRRVELSMRELPLFGFSMEQRTR